MSRLNHNTKKSKRDYYIALRVHAKKRAMQRAGVLLSRKEQRELWDVMKESFINVPVPQKGGDLIRYGFFKGKEMLVVLDTGRHLVKTVLPDTDSKMKIARDVYKKYGLTRVIGYD